MKHLTFIVSATALAAVTAFAMQEALHLPEGSKAPAFAGKTHTGKEVSLQSLTKEGPVFVVFWKERCPHNPRASALFNSLYKAYEGKVNMVGIVATSEEKLGDWAKQFNNAYPLLADSSRKLINDYKLVFSICTFQIGKDGTIEKVFPGYGADSMNALNAAMAAAAGTKPANVDLSAAPTKLTWG